MQSILISKNYVVYFEGEGFYADRQPHYYWSFTEKLDKAKMYKTIKGASIHVKRALSITKYASLSPKIFELSPEGLLNPTPVPMGDVRSKIEKEIEENALDPDFLKSLLN